MLLSSPVCLHTLRLCIFFILLEYESRIVLLVMGLVISAAVCTLPHSIPPNSTVPISIAQPAVLYCCLNVPQIAAMPFIPPSTGSLATVFQDKIDVMAAPGETERMQCELCRCDTKRSCLVLLLLPFSCSHSPAAKCMLLAATCSLPYLQRGSCLLQDRSGSCNENENRGNICHNFRMYATSQTVDPLEMRKFQAWVQKWWDEEGMFSVLHAMNDIRVPFIRDSLMSRNYEHDVGCPLSGVNILDVGCGGGLLSEPLGRLGASVTGIDPLEDNIKIAAQHKSFDPVLDKQVQYKSCTVEELVDGHLGYFDAIVASEVLEHVADVESFIQSCFQVLKAVLCLLQQSTKPSSHTL
eukprot:XP_017949304.1 PREDICTED: ubiquinone biosynthesis O-methyltransferase, mitochondrial isoform X2 [Xenopus tropicalis]